MQKHIKITILGKQYSVATDEHDEDLQAAAHMVDSLLQKESEKVVPSDIGKAALAVALQLATDLAKNKRMLQSYEQHVEHLLGLLNHEA